MACLSSPFFHCLKTIHASTDPISTEGSLKFHLILNLKAKKGDKEAKQQKWELAVDVRSVNHSPLVVAAHHQTQQTSCLDIKVSLWCGESERAIEHMTGCFIRKWVHEVAASTPHIISSYVNSACFVVTMIVDECEVKDPATWDVFWLYL